MTQIREKYLKDPKACPFCGSHELLTGAIRSDHLEGKDEYHMHIECNACASTWRDVYTLTQVDSLEDNRQETKQGHHRLAAHLLDW
jgi:formate dehydrogenase maturation protein FdhE